MTQGDLVPLTEPHQIMMWQKKKCKKLGILLTWENMMLTLQNIL